MINIYNINVNDNFLDGLAQVVKIMAVVESSEDTDLTIDFSNTNSVSPVFVLSLIVYLSSCSKNVSIVNIGDYLNTIQIQKYGFRYNPTQRAQFDDFLNSFSGYTFIPIIAFPPDSYNDKNGDISSAIEEMIIGQSQIENNVAQGIKYMIDETLDNLAEHSESSIGYIFAQAYPQKKYLDICIADEGIGLLGSYNNVPITTISDDVGAIKAAIGHVSSKNRPEAENRGFGISSPIRMTVEGLGGQYLMVSGNSFYRKGERIDRYIRLPKGLRWNGTLVAFRIPTTPNPSFNYINYIE